MCVNLQDSVAGMSGGFAGKVVEYPLDTIKVRLQTLESSSRSHRRPPWWRYGLSMLQQEGFRPLYHGLPLPLVGAMLESACMFSIVHQMKWILFGTSNTVNTSNTSVWQTSVAGACAGILTGTLLTPMELVKCRLQLPQAPYRNTWDCITRSVHHEGVSVLWRGYGPTLVREIPGTAIWFGTYESMLRIWTESPHSAQAWQILVSGGMSGLAYHVALFPVDTIKTRCQTDPDATIRRVIQNVWHEQGVAGFYRGIVPTALRALLGNATVFYAYERCVRLLS